MDPVSALGLAASIIAVLQLTGALMKPATSSLGPSENDEKELKRLFITMTGFQIAYNNLERYLESKPGTADTLVAALQQPIHECKAVLAELKLRLSNMTFVRKHIIGRKWDKEFERLVKRLDDARKLFDVVLQGDQSERLINISLFMKEKLEDIGDIKEGIETAGKRLSELHFTTQKNHQSAEIQAAQYQSDLLHVYDSTQNKIDEQFSNLEKIEQRKQKENILHWLEIADPRINHQQAYSTHKPGTGDWFTKGQTYQDWLAKPKSFSWLNGKAGCGKTVLSSTIIESTTAHCDENEGCVMAYFYFSFSDSTKQSYSNMLRSILAQIASQVDVIPDCLMLLSRAYQWSSPPTDALRKTLLTLVDERFLCHVYILVDALDEILDTDQREDTCRILDEVSQKPKAHIIATSRREHDITEYMSECKTVKDIFIQNSEVDHDIQLWVRGRLREDKKLKKWSAIHDDIEAALGKEADGMFRWAACQLDSLKKCLSLKSVQKALKSLPKTLDETYERVLQEIDEEYQHVALEALRWLCFSEEILKINELAEAAVFSAVVQAPSKEKPFDVGFDPNERIQDPLDILGILSGLVITRSPAQRTFLGESNDRNLSTPFEGDNDREETARPLDVAERSEIILAHFSVKEYLVSGRLRSQVQHFAIDKSHAHQVLATNCLYYGFYSQSFLEGNNDWQLSRKRPSSEWPYDASYPLLHYALYVWLFHAKRVEYESELNKLIISVFNTELQLRLSLLLRHFLEIENVASRELSPLYIFSSLGLYLPCKKLLESGTDINTLGGHHGYPLQAASAKGHENIVRLLLEHGADINLQSEAYGSASQVASFRSYENVVQLLLEYGADINLQGGLYGTALQAASRRGYENIVRLLLEHGADVNAQGGEYGTALRVASLWGHNNVVRVLLEHGADVNIQDDSTPIQLALLMKRTETAVILLNRGAIPTRYLGGDKAAEALLEKNFELFVSLQIKA